MRGKNKQKCCSFTLNQVARSLTVFFTSVSVGQRSLSRPYILKSIRRAIQNSWLLLARRLFFGVSSGFSSGFSSVGAKVGVRKRAGTTAPKTSTSRCRYRCRCPGPASSGAGLRGDGHTRGHAITSSPNIHVPLLPTGPPSPIHPERRGVGMAWVRRR